MKFPLNWLQDYITTDLAVPEISKALTLAGLEVESIEETVNNSKPDFIFDVALTPNLGHCASLIGIARELSAATGKPIYYPKISLNEKKNEKANNEIDSLVKVVVEDKKGCPRYACRLIKNVVIGSSPDWLQKRLEACGVRPINNVVDIVNYIVMELGYPLHAFDYDQLEGHQIIVRGANEGEHFVTLDGKDRTLTAGDILICDKNKPVALAGIMGGLNSEVSDKTKNILLEAAYFHPGTIRKTSKRLGLSTDASKRFERGCDPNQVIQSLEHAAMLLQEMAQGQIISGVVDIHQVDFPEKIIECRLSRVNHILGTQLSVNEVEGIFQRLGFRYQLSNQNVFTIQVPTYRVDITGEIDLIEEVARIYGYDFIIKPLSPYHSSPVTHAPLFLFERQVRNRMVAEGLQEFITCDLIGPSIMAVIKDNPMPEEATIHVLNPTSIEQSILRTSLLPGLLQLAKYNYDHQHHDVSGFEIGRIHFKDGENYKEQSVLGLVMMGKSSPQYWGDKPKDVTFFELKGILENVLFELNIEKTLFQNSSYSILHSGRQASIFVDDLEIGSIGEVHPSILRRLDLPQRVYYAELSLHDLMQVKKEEKRMKALPIYPGSERDWTVTISDEVPVAKLFDAINHVGSTLLEEVSLKDIYQSEKLGKGLKNVTLHFVYRDLTKTIEQEVVDAEHKRIINAVESSIKKSST